MIFPLLAFVLIFALCSHGCRVAVICTAPPYLTDRFITCRHNKKVTAHVNCTLRCCGRCSLPLPEQVFCVLTLQMLFSFGVLCASFSGGKEGRTNKWLYVSSLLTFSGFAVALSICKSFSRRHPWNIAGWVGDTNRSRKPQMLHISVTVSHTDVIIRNYKSQKRPAVFNKLCPQVVVTVSLSHMVGTIASFLDLNHVFITVGVLMVIAVAIVAFSAKVRHCKMLFGFEHAGHHCMQRTNKSHGASRSH